jgi:hypothetical protein
MITYKKHILASMIFVSGILSAQQSYTFTTCGATGQNGPSQTQVTNSYQSTNLSGLVTATNGIQYWTVPNGVSNIRIETYGAKGGNVSASGGAGARMRGDFTVTPGSTLKILVGQQGGNGSNQAGGGGGTYVTLLNNTPLCIAGGGGGAYYSGYSGLSATMAGTTSISGNAGVFGNNSIYYGSGGTNGNGGNAGTSNSGSQGGCGGGLLSNGANGSSNGAYGGTAFVNGGAGGSAVMNSSGQAGHGGFGGGAGGDWQTWTGSGGGGGYSGGSGGTYYGCGGGGGSYNAGTNQNNSSGANAGNGYAVITVLSGVGISETTSVSCNGQTNAVLVASVTGAPSPYTYTWSPGGSTNGTLSGIGAGVYTVNATDGNGINYSSTYTVTQPSVLSATIVGQNIVSCSGANNGGATVTVSGGTGPYNYTWSPNGGNSAASGSLSAGNYTVQVRDARNCAVSRTITITQPAPLSVLGFATNPVVCSGDQSMLIGAGALTYAWSHGVTNGVSFSPVSTAIYTVVGTNSAGCTGQAMVTITVNPKPTITITGTNVICTGQSLNLLASGAISYTWNTGATGNAISDMPTATTSYTASGTNSSGCVNFAVKTVTVINSTPAVTALAIPNQVCIGKAAILRGNGANTYTWTGGITNNVAFIPSATSSYTVTGSNSCGTGSAVIILTVNPLPVIAANSSTPAVCLGKTVTLSGSGGVSYVWTSGVTNNVPFFPVNTANYTVTGTDSKGCQNKATTTVTVFSLPFVSANASATVVCLGNSVTLFGGGANTYVWNNGVTNGISFAPSNTATYNVTGTDANGCQNVAAKTISVVTPPVLTANATSLAVCAGFSTTLYGGGATSYTWSGGVTNNVPFVPSATTIYTVTGANACGTTAATIGITVNPLPAVTANAVSTLICIGSSATLFGGGASSYTWTGGVNNNVSFIPTSTSVYTVTGVNSNGCRNTAVTTLSVIPLPSITATVNTPAVCFGNSVTLNAQGGVTYTWSNGVPNNTPFAPNATATYTVYGSDANGCTNLALRSVTVHQLPAVTANANASQICSGNGVMLYGSGAHTYTWAGGHNNAVTFFPTTTDTYSVMGTNTVTGCSSINYATITVTVNPLPVITASASNPAVCSGQMTALFGGGGHSYSWSGGRINGQNFYPSATQAYYVTGTNSVTGCVNIAMITITVNPLPIITTSISSTQVCQGNTVAVYGLGAHTYTWNAGIQNGVPFTATGPVTYWAYGTNTITGCTSQNPGYQTVFVNQAPNIAVVTSNSVICFGKSITLQTYGANTYTWSNGIVSGVPFSPTVTATYTVSGTNTTTGCSKTMTYMVVVNPLPTVTAIASQSAICIGNSVNLTAQGANVYTFNPGIFYGMAFTPTVTKTYTVIGQSFATGCISNVPDSVTIIVNPLPVVSGSSNPPLVCHGTTVTLNGSGADTYTWTGGVQNGVPFTPVIASTYSVTGTNTTTGCKSTNKAAVTLSMVPLPIVFSSASHAEICKGSTVALNGSGAHTYTWSNGVLNGIPFTPSASATYSVVGKDTITGCTSINAALQSIVVKTLPPVMITQTDSTICEGDNTTLIAQGALTYTWNNGPTTSVNQVTPVITTAYVVMGLGPNGCVNTATVTQIVSPCTGIAESSGNTLKIYPNPNAGEFYIETDKKLQLQVFNELGQQIRSIVVGPGSPEAVNLSEYANGIYFIVAQDASQIINRKIVINK